MNQEERALAFAGLHRKGDPVVLYNIWDAGSARCVAEAGAKALATGSWSVAAAHGFADGQKIPLPLLIEAVREIVTAIDLPLSVDFEGAYSEDPAQGAANVAQLIDAGAVGINFEDQVVGKGGIHPTDRQVARIRAIREMAERQNISLFINARTDLFLQEGDAARHASLLDEAIARAKAYAGAGASGFFAPGLAEADLIARLCAASPLPVNVMMKPGAPDLAILATAGVGRVSYGPFPYRAMIARLRDEAEKVYRGAAK
ncbi:isocitrate lyase/phosphoenolpyruvate mutase family protein [Sinorhizobium numidicum]|uniref:Isocitrate lyase/phosphoenolpyruvate mutase family protein n=1 Tax=Sinorhizobium numidicum TaxID=680248 RepID=A0ABY8D0S0_9HYPH|nr:isocitrate lyase/phosphoenolpyruvate mutase family protein [Sinorhizobium numidicum]WEX77821.1 isocitrate lyase/phosphoenolpyruvate mutase family protein [Sinorhizobium numidicum]WEX84480.1 isocitrate lyase/phosphoenolpyruvate mutase family protein [Sinorhizobium numidicum]